MSGDRLAQFRQNIEHCRENDGVVVVTGVDFAKAMLDVAEAARRVRDYAQLEDDAHLFDALPELAAALARLDSGATEGEA